MIQKFEQQPKLNTKTRAYQRIQHQSILNNAQATITNIGRFKFKVNINHLHPSDSNIVLFNNQHNFALIQQYLKNKLKATELNIIDNEYVVKNWKFLFFYVIQTSIQKLRILHNINSTILTDLFHINFMHLKQLQLTANLIHNIQSIQYINAPELQTLHLHRNKIVNFKPLNKSWFPKLQNLDLSFNKYKYSSIQLNRTKTSNQLDVFHSPDSFLQTSIQDIGSFFKIQSKIIKQMTILSEQRILQPKVFIILKQRYKQIIIQDDPRNKKLQDIIQSIQYFSY